MNRYTLPKESIHRGTYLEERDCPTDIATYDAHLDLLLKEFGKAHRNAEWIKRTRQGATARSSFVDAGGAVPWAGFLDDLIHVPDTISGRPELLSLIPKVTECSDSIVFAPAFRNAALLLVVSLYDKASATGSQSVQWSLLSDLVLAHFWRLKEHSQYVLYTHYVTSGMTYSTWCESFHVTSDAKNPWVAICNEYPLLLRMLHNASRQFVDCCNDLFIRLAHDRLLIESKFGIKASDSLTECDPTLSDPHKDGRTVMRLKFASGSTLIYKPKNLIIEQYFNNFVRHHADATGFDSLSVLNMGEYGWVEDAATNESSYADIPSHVGRATAWLWLLNATDMHEENLCPGAAGVRGLDLETLLSVRTLADDYNIDDNWRDQSITSTLLFDSALAGSSSEIGYSGFNAAGFTRTPYSKVVFSVAEDKVIVNHVPTGTQIPLSQSENRSNWKNTKTITDSFLQNSPKLKQLVNEFIRNLPVETPLRTVFRPTNFYFQMFHRLRQPRFLRDGAFASIELLKLHHSSLHFTNPAHTQAAEKVINDEIRQLMNGDIPFFSRTAGDTILGLSNDTVDSFFADTGKGYVETKLNAITESDFKEQHALLSVALGRPSIALYRKPAFWETYSVETSSSASPAEKLVQLLEMVSLDLIESAFCHEDAIARWVCIPGGVDADQLRAEAGDVSMFSGSLGIVLALQALEQTLRGTTAWGQINSFLDQQSLQMKSYLLRISKNTAFKHGSLGFSGLGGDLFAYALLISMAPNRWGFLELYIDRLLDDAVETIGNDTWLDVIAGSAGLVLGCDRVIQTKIATLSAKAVLVMNLAALHLVRNAKSFDDTLAWTIPTERLPLLSYAHGWAGIICALQTAVGRCSDRGVKAELQSCVAQAAGFPAIHLNGKYTWLDYRGSKDKDKDFDVVNRSWCNGTAGILRGLLSVKSYWTKELENAAHTASVSLAANEQGALRFCCGYSGEVDVTLDCLSLSSARRTDLLEGMTRSLSLILNNHKDNEIWECVELAFPSLYQGKAGIAYTAARLINNKIPSLSGAALPQKL